MVGVPRIRCRRPGPAAGPVTRSGVCQAGPDDRRIRDSPGSGTAGRVRVEGSIGPGGLGSTSGRSGGGMSDGAPRRRLRGRRRECAELDRLVAEAAAGRSRVLVLRGESGMGKSALVEYLVQRAAEFRVLRAVGVESEMEMAFAGLHQLC